MRTDPELPRHKGISWVICDMTLPGIDVRPIKAMSGLTHFAQVFYDNVRIPLSNVVGEINGGWRVAMTTLGFERGTGTIAHQIELANVVDRLIDWARTHGGCVDEVGMARLVQLKVEVMALRSLTAASVSRGMREEVPGAEGNIVALYFGELSRRVHGAAFDLVGARRDSSAAAITITRCTIWSASNGRLAAEPRKSAAMPSASACSACPREPPRDDRRSQSQRRSADDRGQPARLPAGPPAD